ncbi:MAG: PAS-domain containing protein [Rubrivivax sp.]
MVDMAAPAGAPALLEQRLRAWQIDGHCRGARVAALASVAGACVSLLLLRAQLRGLPAGLWLALLVAVHLWRLRQVAGLHASPRHDTATLSALRRLTLMHAAVWSLLPLCVQWPWTPGTADALALGLGMAVIAGTAMCLMYDARAAVGFALPLLLSLTAATALHAGSGAHGTLMSLSQVAVMAVVLAATAIALRQRLHDLATGMAADVAQGQRSAEGEALLRRVFDHIADGVSMFDADARLVAWNARMVELAGLQPDQVRAGLPLREMMLAMAAKGEFGHEQPLAEVERRLQAIRAPEPTWGRLRRPGGRTVEMRSNPMPDGGFTLLAVDITERQASARALAEHRAMLELLLQNTEEGVWTIDNELRTVDANAAMCRMLGVPREQLLGRTIYDFVDAENERIFRDQVKRRDEGLPGSYEIALRRSDGTLVHTQNNPTPLLDSRGRKVGAIGLFTDITPIRRAAAELAHTSQQLEAQTRVLGATLDSLDQGVLAVDREGRIEAFNQRAVELLQTPPQLLKPGMTLRELVSWQLRAGFFDGGGSEPVARSKDQVQRYVDGDDAAAAVNRYWRERPDGRIIDVQVHPSAGGGQVRTYSDVTERVRSERALIAARDEAERANRAKSEFLSRMSHELRTPLNAVLGFAQLLEHDAAHLSESQRLDHVQQIQRSSHHLLALINDVLDLSRIEAGALPVHLGPVAVEPLLDACRRMVEPMARERGVQLLRRPPPCADVVSADPMRLQQVMLNLLSNAIKYNRVGGDVVLDVLTLPGLLRIEVGDQGPGLSSEQQERLFQAFDRLEADRLAVEGAGIGLALSRALVDLMHGRIGVRSAVGQGSTFWVELPLAAAPAQAVPAPARGRALPALPRRADGGRWRVLYIEDNEVNQIVVQSMLARLDGLDLDLADDPVRGLEHLRATPTDLLLLDIQLPAMDGFEVLRRVRADPATAAMPVLAVSANARAEDLLRAREAGFDHYLTKPLDLLQLVQVLSRLLAGTAAALR